MEVVLILLAVFSVPLAAIGSRTYLKAKAMRASTLTGPLTKRVESLEADNADLKQRLETLETIVTSPDFEETGPPAPERDRSLSELRAELEAVERKRR